MSVHVCACDSHVTGEVVGLLLHDMHINEEGVEPEMKHLIPPSKPRVKELNLDIPTERHGCGEGQFSIGVCPLDVLIHFRRVDLCLVQTDDEARS